MLWVLIGWQFALAEYVGGIVMIVLMAAMLAAVRLSATRGGGPRARRSAPRPAISTTRPASKWAGASG